MGRIGREFLKNEPISPSISDQIDILIINYSECLRIHKLIKIQEEEINFRRNAAHIEINQIRKTLEDLKISSGIPKKELISLQKRKTELIKIRDDEHPIIDTLTGEPLQMTELVYIILKYRQVMDKIELFDNYVLKKKNSLVNWVFKNPLKKLLKKLLLSSNNKKINDFIVELYTIIN